MEIQNSTVGTTGMPPQLGSIGLDYMEIKETLSVRAIEDSKDGKQKLAVKLIEEGWSKNGYYYSKEVAESVADHIKDRPQMYMDHSMGIMMGRSFKDLVAIATESYKKDGSAYAVVEMVDNPSTAWLYDLAQKFPGQVGASIDARAKVKEAEESQEGDSSKENQKYVVEEIVFLNSVDFVTYPSAGGGVVEVMASQIADEATRKLSHLMEEFKNEVANLKIPKEDTQMEEKTKVTDKMTKEAFLEDYPEIAEELRQDYKVDSDAKTETDASVKELEDKVEGLEKKLEEAADANAELTSKVDDYEVKERAKAKKAAVNQAITDSKLDPDFVSEVFIEDLMKLDDEEQIQARIKDRLELVESATGEVSGNGTRVSEDSVDDKEQGDTLVFDTDALVKSMKSYKQFI
jgi:hypothetical protein